MQWIAKKRRVFLCLLGLMSVFGCKSRGVESTDSTQLSSQDQSPAICRIDVSYANLDLAQNWVRELMANPKPGSQTEDARERGRLESIPLCATTFQTNFNAQYLRAFDTDKSLKLQDSMCRNQKVLKQKDGDIYRYGSRCDKGDGTYYYIWGDWII